MNRLIYVNYSAPPPPPPMAYNPRLDFKDMSMENKFILKGNDLHSSARGQKPITKAVMCVHDGTFNS